MKKFWEVKECVSHHPALSIEEKTVHEHFNTAHTEDENGRHIPLLRKKNAKPLGNS